MSCKRIDRNPFLTKRFKRILTSQNGVLAKPFQHRFQAFDTKSRNAPHIDSSAWLKNKKTIINPQNNDKCFQYSITAALNYGQTKNHLERISKPRPFIDEYNWKEISFPSHKNYQKKLELNDKSITLDILYVSHNTEEIIHLYKSKYYFKRKNHVNFLMITNGEK